MAYYLAFDGVNDDVLFDSDVGFNLGNDTYVFEFTANIKSFPTTLTVGIVGTGTSSTGGIVMRAASSVNSLSVVSSNVLRYESGPNFLILNETHTYRLEHDSAATGGQYRWYRDGALFSNGIYTASINLILKNIGKTRTDGLWANMNLYSLSFVSGFSSNPDYQPSLSQGAGNRLLDAKGLNSGTLNNFPLDNSQWVFYDDGGGSGEYTAAISSTTFLPTSLVSATNTKPEYSASINSTTPLPLSSIAAESTRPQYSATIASNTLLPTGTVILDSVTPAYSVSIVGSTLLPTSSVGLDNETPQNSVIVNSTTLVPIGTVQLSAIKPEYVLSVSGATPLPTSTVMLTPLGAGDYVTTISSSTLLPQGSVELGTISPVGLSIVSNTPLPFSSVVLDYENYSISISSSTLLPVGSVELDSVIPEYSLGISSSTKLPSSIVVLINGEIINYTNPKNIVTLTYRKGVSKLTVSDNNIKLIYSNNLIKLRN